MTEKQKAKVTYFTNLRGDEGPGFVFEQIRLALEEAGILYNHKHLSVTDPIEYNIKALNDIKGCDVFIRSVYELRGLYQFRKAKSLGITTIGTSFSTHATYREKILAEIYNETGVDMRPLNLRRLLKEAKYIDYYLVLSEFSKRTFVLNGIAPERVFVAQPGVDADKFRFTEQPSDFKLLFVGTNALRKGVVNLLRAWKELDIVGELVTRCGVLFPDTKNVTRILQWQSEKDLVDLYRECSLTILPSLEEGFPATNLESMACGKPVIATDVTGIGDVITNYEEGVVIPSGDVKAIKNAILYFYDNPSELIRMGKNARKTAEKCTWERFRVKVAEIVKQISEEAKK